MGAHESRVSPGGELALNRSPRQTGAHPLKNPWHDFVITRH